MGLVEIGQPSNLKTTPPTNNLGIRQLLFLPSFPSPLKLAQAKSPNRLRSLGEESLTYLAEKKTYSLKIMLKTISVEEHDTEVDRTNNTAQFKRGFEPKDFWASGMHVWSDHQLFGNKMLRMHGTVTGSLTQLIVPANSPNSPAVATPTKELDKKGCALLTQQMSPPTSNLKIGRILFCPTITSPSEFASAGMG